MSALTDATATFNDHSFTPRNGIATTRAKNQGKNVLIMLLAAVLIFMAGVDKGHNDLIAKTIASHSTTSTTTVVPTSK